MSNKFNAPARKIFANNNIINYEIFSMLGIQSYGLFHATREILKNKGNRLLSLIKHKLSLSSLFFV